MSLHIFIYYKFIIPPTIKTKPPIISKVHCKFGANPSQSQLMLLFMLAALLIPNLRK